MDDGVEDQDEDQGDRGKAVRLDDDAAQSAVDSRMAAPRAVEVEDRSLHIGAGDSCAVNGQISRVDLMEDDQMEVVAEEEEGAGKHCTMALRTSYGRSQPLPRGSQVPSDADQDAADGKSRHIPHPRHPPPPQ